MRVRSRFSIAERFLNAACEEKQTSISRGGKHLGCAEVNDLGQHAIACYQSPQTLSIISLEKLVRYNLAEESSLFQHFQSALDETYIQINVARGRLKILCE